MEKKKNGKKFRLKGVGEFKFSSRFSPKLSKMLGREVPIEDFITSGLSKTVKALIPDGEGGIMPVPLSIFVNPPVPPQGLTI